VITHNLEACWRRAPGYGYGRRSKRPACLSRQVRQPLPKTARCRPRYRPNLPFSWSV